MPGAATISGSSLTYSLEEGEQVLSMTVQVSRKEALEGPESVQFLEADSLEKAQVESHKTWRPLLDGELRGDDEIIPCSVIYTKKRDGRYK